jgi:hypothetical protein
VLVLVEFLVLVLVLALVQLPVLVQLLVLVQFPVLVLVLVQLLAQLKRIETLSGDEHRPNDEAIIVSAYSRPKVIQV